MKIRVLSIITCFCLLFCLVSTVDAAHEPTTISQFNFNPTWNIEVSDSFDATLGALGVGVSVDFNYNFDAGVSLPVILNVEHPRYVLEDGSAMVNISSEGAQGGRAWAYASGGVSASIDAGPLGSYSLIDRSINIGDEISFETPFGTEDTITFDAEMLLGSETISLLLVSYTFELYIRVTVAVIASTWLSSDLSITGTALTSPVQDDCQWNSESDIETCLFSVGDQTGTFVDLEFENVVMHIERLSFVLQSMSFHLRADGSEVAAIQVPTPPLSFSLASDHRTNPNDGGFIPLADASGTTRDLDSKILSIHVGVPLPNIPGILFMVIPSISGIVYGRRREEGSKGIGVALLAIVVIGAGVYLGLDYLNQPSTTVLVSSFMTSLIPPFDVGGDVIDMLMSYLPWMLAGLAVGGATKNLKTGAILGFGGPMTLFVLNGVLQGDLQLLTSIPEAVPAIVAGFVATGFGILGAVLVQVSDSQTTTSAVRQFVETPPSPTSQSKETYTPPFPLSEEELDDSKIRTAASTVPWAVPAKRRKSSADSHRARASWSKTYFYPSKTVLNGIILISILITLFQFGSEAVFYGTALGTFLSSFIVGPLDPSAFATLSFGLLGQGIAIIGMVLLTAVSTRGIHGEKQKLSEDMSISGDVIGVGLFGGLITFILMAKYILIALIIIGVLFMVISFGGMFSSWGASPEQAIMIGAIGAIPFIIITFALLLVFTLIASTISNTIAGIYCYLGFNRTRKKS